MKLIYILQFLFLALSQLANGQKIKRCNSMCMLIDTIDSAYTSNYYEKELFIIKKGDYFLYDGINAYLQNGQYGNISEEKVQYLDSVPPFKLYFNDSNFIFSRKSEIRREIKKHTKQDFTIFLQDALKGNFKSFEKFLNIYNKLDGHSAEFYDELIWQFLNFVGDNYVLAYLQSDQSKNKSLVARYFVTEIYANFPICNKIEYSRLYFPKSYEFAIQQALFE